MCNIKSVVILLFSVSLLNAQTYRYVTPTGGGTFDGTSWANAYTGNNLQTAIDEAGVTDVWVAAGTYIPQSAPGLGAIGSRYYHFRMKNGVNIRGGFTGTEDPSTFNLNTRNFATNETILSGDIGTIGDSTDNCYHVIFNCFGYGMPATNNQPAALDTTAVIDGFTITRGYATGMTLTTYGSGLLDFGCSTKVINCTFKSNSATGQNGGAIYCESCSPVIRNCTLINNTSINYVGGIGLFFCTNVIINGCIFNNNTGSNGGALYTYSSSATITNCIFENNNIPDVGGAIYLFEGSPVISNCSFINNQSEGFGGAVFISSSATPQINNCSFTSNKSGDGAAIYNAAASIIANCVFDSNIASGYGGCIVNTDTSKISYCTFNNNQAAFGGTIYNVFSDASTITNCTFNSNSSSSVGGAIYNSNTASPNIKNCLFYANRSRTGGAIESDNNCNPAITNCIFNKDSAINLSQGGGAIATSNNCNTTIINCTFSNNYGGYGGALNFSGGTQTITNSIIWGNIAATTGNQIYQTAGALALTNSCYQSGVNDITGTPTVSNCITTDPRFVDQAGGDLHLNTDSPCLGAGTSAGAPTIDYDGNTRPNPVATNPDIGAYEGIKTYSSDNNVTITSGPDSTFNFFNFPYPADNDFPFQAVRILSLPTTGAFKYNGANVTANTDYTDPTKFEFTCPPIGSGIPYTTFTFKVKNNHGNYSGPTYSMNIKLPPDPPVIYNMDGTVVDCTDGVLTDIADGLIITAPNDTLLNGASVQITSNYIAVEDTLLFTNVDGITGSWSADKGKLSFTGNTLVTNYQTLLRSVKYKNNNPNPSPVTKTVIITINSRISNSFTVTRILNIVKTPYLTLNKTLMVDQGASAVINSTYLNAGDSSYPGSAITYIITKTPLHGLLINGKDTVTSSNHKFFNNNSIDSGYVRYIHDGSSSPADSFSFRLTNPDSSILSQQYSFIIDINNPPQVISKLPDLIINKNRSLEIDIDTLSKYVRDPNNTSSQLIFKFQSKTGNIKVEKNSDTTYLLTPIKDWIGVDTIKVIIAKGNLSTDTSMLVKVSQVDGVEKLGSGVPKQYSLEQNYPNPFNPTTKIRFNIPQVKDNGGANVTLQIYDALGRKIITLLNNAMAAGIYETSFNAVALPSGIYFYRLMAGSFIQTKKMLLIK